MADKPQGGGGGADETFPELTPAGANETFPELTPTGAGETFPELAAPEETLAGGAPNPNETFIDEGETGAGSTATSPLTTRPPSEPETFIEEEVPSPATGDTTGSTIVSGGDIIEEMTQSGQAVSAPAVAAQPGAEFLPLERKRPKSDVWTLFLVFAFVIFCGGIFLTGKELYDLYDVKFGILSKEGEIPQTEGAAAQKPAEDGKKEPAAKEGDQKDKEKAGDQKPSDGDQKKADEEKKPADGQGEKKDGDGGWPGEPKKN